MWEIYALGDVNFLTKIFEGLVLALGGSALTVAVKVFLLLSILYLGFVGLFQASGIPFQRVLVTWVIYSVMFVPHVTVVLKDRNTLNTQFVDGVPLGVAAFASVTSLLGKQVAELMEQAFSSAKQNDVSGGTTASFEYMLSKRNEILNKSFISSSNGLMNAQRSWQNYIQDCTNVGLTLHKGANWALEESDVLRKALPDALRFDSDIYYTSVWVGNRQQHLSCTQAFTAIKSQFTEEINAFLNKAVSGFGANSAVTGILSAPLKHESQSVSLNRNLTSLTNGQLNAQDYMLAVSLAQLMSETDAYTALGKAVQRQAISQLYSQWSLQGSIFITTVKPILTFLEGFFYAVAPIMMLLMLLGNYGMSLLGKYSLLMIWLQLWHPIIAVVNLYYHSAISKSIGELTAGSLELDSFIGITLFNQKLESYLGTSGLILSGVGSLALFLVYGGSVAATSLVSKISAPEASAQGARTLSPEVVSSAPVIQTSPQFASDSFVGIRRFGADSSIGSINIGTTLSNMRSAAASRVVQAQENLTSLFSHGSTNNVIDSLSLSQKSSLATAVSKNSGLSRSAVMNYLTQDSMSMGNSGQSSMRTEYGKSEAWRESTERGIGRDEQFVADLSASAGFGIGSNEQTSKTTTEELPSAISKTATADNSANKKVTSESFRNGWNADLGASGKRATHLSNRTTETNNESRAKTRGTTQGWATTTSQGYNHVMTNGKQQTEGQTDSMAANIAQAYVKSADFSQNTIFGTEAKKQISSAYSKLEQAQAAYTQVASVASQTGASYSMPIMAMAQQISNSGLAKNLLNTVNSTPELSASFDKYNNLYEGLIPNAHLRGVASAISTIFNNQSPISNSLRENVVSALYPNTATGSTGNFAANNDYTDFVNTQRESLGQIYAQGNAKNASAYAASSSRGVSDEVIDQLVAGEPASLAPELKESFDGTNTEMKKALESPVPKGTPHDMNIWLGKVPPASTQLPEYRQVNPEFNYGDNFPDDEAVALGWAQETTEERHNNRNGAFQNMGFKE